MKKSTDSKSTKQQILDDDFGEHEAMKFEDDLNSLGDDASP